jgi:hypothetical protein
MKKVFVLFLVIISNIACKKDELTTEVVYPKEALGTLTTVWTKAIQDKNSIVFVNDKGERKSFSIQQKKEKPILLSVYNDTVKGQVFDVEAVSYTLTNTANSTEIIHFLLLGNQFVCVSDKIQPQVSEQLFLFRIYSQKVGWLDPNYGYSVQFGYAVNEIKSISFQYGSNFPELGSDKADVEITKADSFLKQITLSHAKGIESFKDMSGVNWKLSN